MSAKRAPAATASGGSFVALAAVALLLAGAGGAGGFFLVRHAMQVARAEPPAAEAGSADGTPAAAYSGTRRLTALPPIISTMATPDVWLRMEAAIIHDEAHGKLGPELPIQIAGDILASVRTLTVGHIAGPSGFLHLKADLEERARIRSGGLVQEVVIHTLVYE